MPPRRRFGREGREMEGSKREGERCEGGAEARERGGAAGGAAPAAAAARRGRRASRLRPHRERHLRRPAPEICVGSLSTLICVSVRFERKMRPLFGSSIGA